MVNRLLPYYRREGKLLSLFLLFSLMVTMLDFVTPIYIKNLIDQVIPEKNLQELGALSGILFMSYIVRYFLGIYSNMRGQTLGNRIKYHMREDLFQKIIEQPKIFFHKFDRGDIISRITGDLESISQLLHRGMEELLFTGIAIFGAVVIMFQFNWKLTLITLIPLPGGIIFSVIQNARLKKSYKGIRESLGDLTSELFDILNNIFVVKNYQLEKEKKIRFQQSNGNILSGEEKNISTTSNLISGINLYNQVTQLIVIFFGGYLHIKGEISLGIILSFILLTNRFRIYLMKLLGLIDIYQRGIAGVGRFMEIMELEESRKGEISLNEEIREIEFKNLTFAFDDKIIFKNLNLKIVAGEKIALVGKSGVGKSTLLSILKGELEPTEGRVLINGIDLSKINRKEYLNRVGIVDQNNQIFKKDVLENVAIIDRERGEKEIIDALEKTKSEHLLYISEAEIEKLSSGERQRIALARIFFRDPQLVLLDEGTSVLDNLTERFIMGNLLESFNKKIIIAVAHRIKAIKNFDRIIYLDEQGISESGSYDELIALGGEFKKICLGEI